MAAMVGIRERQHGPNLRSSARLVVRFRAKEAVRMTDAGSRRERWAEADAARANARWGMSYVPDPRTASPDRLAYEAYERGDRWFQIDLVVHVVQGAVNLAHGYTRVHRGPEYDAIGPIEAQGWKLEHVSTTFVQHGQSTMSAVGGAAEEATHGVLIGLYVFRRGERASGDAV
jgi:hypothetical protein